MDALRFLANSVKVYFSSKVTHSVIRFLQRQDSEPESLYDWTSLSPEILTEPNAWLESHAVESFFREIEKNYKNQSTELFSFRKVGHESVHLKTWGVLDSVLRMIPDVHELFSHPQRILAYFISPAPPLLNMEREEERISFDLPLSSKEYPLVCEFLSGAIEALPGFIGDEAAHVQWLKTRILIHWKENHENKQNKNVETTREEITLVSNGSDFFSPDWILDLPPQENYEDQIVSLTEQLKKKEILLESIEYENQILERKIEEFKSHSPDENFQKQKREHELRDLIWKNQDYFNRANQLVILMKKAQDENQVGRMMQKLDWPLAQQNFYANHEKIVEMLSNKDSKNKEKEQELPVFKRNMNEFLENILSEQLSQTSKNVLIQKLLFYDREVKIQSDLLSQILEAFISARLEQAEDEGFMRVIARPKGKKIEIELSDTFVNPSRFSSGILDDQSLQKIFQKYNWKVDCHFSPKRGAVLWLELPQTESF